MGRNYYKNKDLVRHSYSYSRKMAAWSCKLHLFSYIKSDYKEILSLGWRPG